MKLVIEDISSVRFDKINRYLESLPAENLILNLTNICARELEQIRPFISEIFRMKLETLSCKSNN